jgi:ABC-2 type transport system permease protein
MRAAVHAEWTKLRTVAAPAWLLVAAVALTVALGALVSATCSTAGCIDPTKLSLTGIQLGQAVIAVVAVLMVGDEYRTGMIRTTLATVPRRSVALAAKAFVVLGPVLVAASVAVGGSLLAGHQLMPTSFAGSATLRAAVGSVLYLGLIALLSLGVAVAVRDSAAAIGVVLGLLYLFPILAATLSDPEWQRHVKQIGPSSAGLASQVTVGAADLPIGPWAGLGVLALWATGALLAGAILLRTRDA